MPTKEWRKKNPERQKELARVARARRWQRIKNDPELKAKACARMRAWYAKPENKAKALTRHSKDWHENPEIKRRRISGRLKTNYGITIEQKEEMLRSQGGKCAICFEIKHEHLHSWHVDHCHETKRVRGVLCSRCNLAIGHAGDNPITLRSAADYLDRFSVPLAK